MRGKGTPVTGMMPMHIPMFSNSGKGEEDEDPDAEQAAHHVPRVFANHEHAPGDEAEQRHDGDRPNKAHLLADRGEDEVGLLFGHVAERGLKSVEQPRAVDPPRANGALGIFTS